MPKVKEPKISESENIGLLLQGIKALGGKPSVAMENLATSAAKTSAKNTIFWPDGVEDQVKAAVMSKSHTLLFGPPGTGKSSMARYILEEQGIPYERVQYHRDMDAQDHIGSVSVKESNGASVTDIVWSPNIEAMELGHAIVGDEFDTLNPATSFPLFAQLDDSPFITVQCNGVSRYLEKHPNFFLIATSNTNMTGDDGGNFAGTDIQNEALVDRFPFMIKVDYINADQEFKLVGPRVEIEQSVLKGMIATASATRSAAAAGSCTPISTRRILAWAEAYQALEKSGVRKAHLIKISAEMAILSRSPDEGYRAAIETFMHDAGFTWSKQDQVTPDRRNYDYAQLWNEYTFKENN